MTTTPAARQRRRVRLPLLAAAGAAWAALALAPIPMAMSMGMSGHDPAGPMADMAPAPGLAEGTLAALPGTALMVVAMMWPLLVAPIAHVRARSLARRRRRATALFLGAYTLVWLLACLLLGVVATAVAPPGALVVVSAVVVGALVWRLSPLEHRCAGRLHAHPALPAFGVPAALGALRSGAVHALWCVGSCWVLMLLPFVVPVAHLPVMAAVTLWIAAERSAPPSPARWGRPPAGEPFRSLSLHLRRAAASVGDATSRAVRAAAPGSAAERVLR